MVVNTNRYVPYAPFLNQLGTMVYNGTKPVQRIGRGYSRTVTTTKRKQRKQLASSIKRVITNEKPAKHLSFFTSSALTHNTILSMSPTQGVVQGDTNADRDGDQIQLCALKLKGSFFAPTTANGYSYRIMVGYSGEEYPTGTALTASGLVEAEIFLPNTGTGQRTNALNNPKAFTVLYDETVDVNSLISGVQDVYSYSLTVPLNDSKFYYQSNQSTYGKTKSLYVVVIPSVIAGTLGITSAGNVHISADLIFK